MAIERKWTLAASGCYVGPKGGEVFVRRILSLQGDRVVYMDYGLDEGDSIGEGVCRNDTFRNWITRMATEEEVLRLHTSPEHRDRRRQFEEKQVLIMRQALSERSIITDEILLAEVRRRGLKVGKAKEASHGRNV